MEKALSKGGRRKDTEEEGENGARGRVEKGTRIGLGRGSGESRNTPYLFWKTKLVRVVKQDQEELCGGRGQKETDTLRSFK